MNGLKITAFFGLFLSANTAIAIQGGAIVPVAASLSGVIQVNGDDTNCLDIHPYSLNDAAMPYAKVSMSLQDSVSAMTKKVGVSLGQSVQKKQTYRFRNLEHAEGKFCDMHNDIVMVNGYVRSSFRPSDASMEQGYIGLAPGSAQGLSNPEAIDKVLEVVSDAEIQYDKLGPSCLMVEGDELVLTKEVHFTDPRLGLPMIARVQPDKVTISQNHFSAAGQVEAYVLNPDDGALTTYNYSTFNDGTSNMSSPNFITAVEGSSRASETDLDFSGYASSSANFEEANAYAHVNEAFATYAASGFGFYGPAPMSVGVRDTFGTGVTQDNAVFIPGSSTSTGRPQIRLGEGTGTSTGSPRLQNLGLDLDVVAHELGHYVLFETLKDASAGSESLVIHEGGADFLAFAHSGDACLGESTCPSGSVICAQTSCLRSGLNSNKITDGQFDPQTEFHLLGQVISGSLWDLRSVHSIPAAEVTSLFLDAVQLLVFDSGYRDLFLALLTADRNNFAGEHAEEICAVISARGFSSFLEDVNCPNPTSIPAISGLGGVASGGVGQIGEVFARSQSVGGGCGVVGAQNLAGQKVPFALFLLAILPLVFVRRDVDSKA